MTERPYREPDEGPARTYTVSAYEPPDSDRDPTPPVIFWYRVYASTMSLVLLAYLALAIMNLVATHDAALFDPATGAPLPDPSAHLFAVPFVLVAAVVGGIHVVGAFAPRKPWGWSLGMVVLGMGCTSCSVVFTLPMLILWLKPLTRAAFMRI